MEFHQKIFCRWRLEKHNSSCRATAAGAAAGKGQQLQSFHKTKTTKKKTAANEFHWNVWLVGVAR